MPSSRATFAPMSQNLSVAYQISMFLLVFCSMAQTKFHKAPADYTPRSISSHLASREICQKALLRKNGSVRLSFGNQIITITTKHAMHYSVAATPAAQFICPPRTAYILVKSNTIKKDRASARSFISDIQFPALLQEERPIRAAPHADWSRRPVQSATETLFRHLVRR